MVDVTKSTTANLLADGKETSDNDIGLNPVLGGGGGRSVRARVRIGSQIRLILGGKGAPRRPLRVVSCVHT